MSNPGHKRNRDPKKSDSGLSTSQPPKAKSRLHAPAPRRSMRLSALRAALPQTNTSLTVVPATMAGPSHLRGDPNKSGETTQVEEETYRDYATMEIEGKTINPQRLQLEFQVPFSRPQHPTGRRSANIYVVDVEHEMYLVEKDYDLPNQMSLRHLVALKYSQLQTMTFDFSSSDSILALPVQQDILSAYKVIIPILHVGGEFGVTWNGEESNTTLSKDGVYSFDILAGMLWGVTSEEQIAAEVWNDDDYEWSDTGAVRTIYVSKTARLQ